MELKLIDLDFCDTSPVINDDLIIDSTSLTLIQLSELFSTTETVFDSLALIIVGSLEGMVESMDTITYVNDLDYAKFQRDSFYNILDRNDIVSTVEVILNPKKRIKLERVRVHENEWYIVWTKTCIVDGFGYESMVLISFGESMVRCASWFERLVNELGLINKSSTIVG